MIPLTAPALASLSRTKSASSRPMPHRQSQKDDAAAKLPAAEFGRNLHAHLLFSLIAVISLVTSTLPVACTPHPHHVPNRPSHNHDRGPRPARVLDDPDAPQGPDSQRTQRQYVLPLRSPRTFLTLNPSTEAKELGIPPPPKIPMGAYAEYFRELYPTIRNDHVRENGKIDTHEVARVAGARWNALSTEDRKVMSPSIPSREPSLTPRRAEIRRSSETIRGEIQGRLQAVL